MVTPLTSYFVDKSYKSIIYFSTLNLDSSNEVAVVRHVVDLFLRSGFCLYSKMLEIFSRVTILVQDGPDFIRLQFWNPYLSESVNLCIDRRDKYFMT